MSKAERKQRAVLTPGEVIKELRQRKGWTQRQLAEITEIAVTNLSNIERGNIRLGEDRAILLATALGISPHFILFPNGYERPDLAKKIERIKKNLRNVA